MASTAKLALTHARFAHDHLFTPGDTVTWYAGPDAQGEFDTCDLARMIQNYGPGPFVIAQVAPVPSHLQEAVGHPQYVRIDRDNVPVREWTDTIAGITVSFSGAWFQTRLGDE